MMIKRHTLTWISRTAVLVLCMALAAVLFRPAAVNAKNTPKTVRVGWYESSFNTTDSAGRRSGYAYEYQMKIAAYAGWEYTYVSGSWSELLQMLIDGEIDLMSDVSYTEERAEKMLFPEYPMGAEEYFLFISPKNREITANDYSTLNGKRVGVNKDSIQEMFFQEWSEKHGVQAQVVELTTVEADSKAMLQTGALDAYITPNAFLNPQDDLVPVCEIGASDYYFAVNQERPDLLSDLNAAMNHILNEDPYYNQRMSEKHIHRFGANAFLTEEEESWLSSHGVIRVGYQDNYLAFCAQNPDTGELTGALKDYLASASNCFTDEHLEFEAVAYPTVVSAVKALRDGEIDCVFPANLSSYDGETQHLMMTPSMMRTDVYAVVRQSEQKIFTDKEHVIVALNEGNTNYTVFLQDNFPNWRAVYFPTTPDCLKAVSQGVADCVLISSFRYNNISRLCKNYHLTTYDTGIGVDYSFAVAQGESELYSILSKAVALVPDSAVNAALSYYIAEDTKLSFIDFISDNLIAVLGVALAVVLIIFFLFMKSKRSEQKARKLISATETDDLTGLYNRDYFFQYANRMYRERPDTPRDAIVINIEQFHSINALNGREFGDQVLRVLGNEISTIANEFSGIGGRFGADRFDIYCRHIEDYQAVFKRMQSRLDTLTSNVSVRLRMGVMPWQEKIEPIQLFDRARTACNMARGHYAEHLIVFDEQVRERELFDQRLLNDLRGALDNYEFEVYYQPKFDIRGDEPKLIGAEALIRWRHPEMGLITPDRFIPLFERNGKTPEVDQYVWSLAARQISCWKAKYGILIPVSVNLSRVDVFDSSLMTKMDDILMREGLEHSALELEITESAYTDNENQLVHVTKSLHRKGYTIEMDDFGTGYSSLNMLSALPIDVLKMDRAFIQNIDHNQKDAQMVSLILGIAKNLGLPVVAEGVETEAQLRMLKELGCSFVQGFYFSRPLHPSEFEEKFLAPLP